jgi:hypothetical protein
MPCFPLSVHDWLSSMEAGHEMGAVFFDLTKAFDSVPHRQLICKLRAIGLDDYLISWISNYLTGRSQSVVLNGETSCRPPPCEVGRTSGISTWSPAVSTIIINLGREMKLSMCISLQKSIMQNDGIYYVLNFTANVATFWVQDRIATFKGTILTTIIVCNANCYGIRIYC